MKIRNLSLSTQESYISAVEGYAKYFDKSPDQLKSEDAQRYLLYLMEERKLAWNSCNVVVSALRFFYKETLGDRDMKFFIPPRKKQTLLPQVLSAGEIEKLFSCTQNLKHKVLLMTTYAGGLRVSEVVRDERQSKLLRGKNT